MEGGVVSGQIYLQGRWFQVATQGLMEGAKYGGGWLIVPRGGRTLLGDVS